ncbi:MAG: flavodoxin family protein [Pseudolabrys sp.]
MALKIFAFNCTLKPSPAESSTDKLLGEILDEFKKYGGEGEIVRAVDFNIKPGVKSDEGAGDDWPALRKKVLAADVFVVGTPIWLGQPSSVCKRLLERMDAFLSEKDDQERMPPYGRVGLVAVVGNEDGAHHVSAEVFQALNDVGFSLASNAMTYWVGEAMGSKDYKDFKTSPKTTTHATAMMVAAAAHLAGVLKQKPYPGLKK